MRTLLVLCAAGFALPQTEAVESAALPATHAARIAPAIDAARRGEWLAGLVAVQEVLDAEEAGSLELAETERAEFLFARGLLAFQAEEETPTTVSSLLASVPSFESARAYAGPGELRLTATYDLGSSYLESAERWRAHVPEVAQAPDAPPQVPLPPPPPDPTGGAPDPAADPPEPPDPLAMARGLYEEAKLVLIERLRSDWRDEDTRANLEWIQRRLRELDEIERQREEQQDQQQEQDPSDDSESEDGEENESEEQENDQEQDGDSDEERAPEDPEDGESEESEEEPPSEDEEPPSEDPSERPEPEAAPPQEQGGEASSQSAPEEERLLTREEVMRLLDQLDDLEDQREALEAAIQKQRRVPVERDW